MTEKDERKKIDEDLKKEIVESKKAQKDISERAKQLEGKIPTGPKKEK